MKLTMRAPRPMKSFQPDHRPTIERAVPLLESGIPCVEWSPKEGILYVFVPETFKIIAVPANSGIELRASTVGLTLDVVPYRVAPAPALNPTDAATAITLAASARKPEGPQ